MITAEEFAEQHEHSLVESDEWDYMGINTRVFAEKLIVFAQLHVQKALEEASENATIDLVEYSRFRGSIIKSENLGQEISTETPQEYYQVNKNSILNSYPLNKIK